MTFISARRVYRREQYRRQGRARPGRPPERAHVVGVWVLDPSTWKLYRAWHRGRTLCCAAGEVAHTAEVVIEMESVTSAPDWQARELKKRLRREGFSRVRFTDEKQLADIIRKSKTHTTREIDPHGGRLPGL